MTGTAYALEESFQREWPGLVAAAARMTGDLDAAEEIVQDVLATALARWPFTGVPERPGAWMLTATRNRARNYLRDQARRRVRQQEAAILAPAPIEQAPADQHQTEQPPTGQENPTSEGIDDDRLRLVFMCCHPLLSVEAQVSLTLRLVGGLSTSQIARAFLQPPTTIGQRLSRAKRTLVDARVAFAAPGPHEWGERLPAVLGVVYLIFNEGYSSAEGPTLTRSELGHEALRLGRLLAELLPDEAEVHGLVALMAFQSSRLATRVDESGELVLLADQDRGAWDWQRIGEGQTALVRAWQLGRPGPLTLQAEIAGCHAQAPTWEATDWTRIVGLYDTLMARSPSPVVALNRVVAVAMLHGPEIGLAEVDSLARSRQLDQYHLLWATQADLARRCGRLDEAAGAYRRALDLATNPAERRFLAGRLAECECA
jgi:RNA polymerase sigma-70 factor (ECF subfamily)